MFHGPLRPTHVFLLSFSVTQFAAILFFHTFNIYFSFVRSISVLFEFLISLRAIGRDPGLAQSLMRIIIKNFSEKYVKKTGYLGINLAKTIIMHAQVTIPCLLFILVP